MPAERLSMRKIKELLRLKYEQGLSNRKIAQSCGIARATVSDYLNRLVQAGITWPLPEELSEVELEMCLFPVKLEKVSSKPHPDWQKVHHQLSRKGVTLYLLWEEYKQLNPNGLCYTRYCQLYSVFSSTLEPWMRQIHVPGEKLFVDYAGMTLPFIDATTGEVTPAQIFVAVLGASNFTFIEATTDQSLPNWIGSHVRAFAFFGGVPALLIPDNLKSGVTVPHRYDPDANPTYCEMARHYGVAILPARVRKPKDKSKAEVGVEGIERRILASLRDHTFFSIAEMNQAIAPLLTAYNQRPFQKLPGCRQVQFDMLDKPALKPLPLTPYVFALWKKARVGMDYHVEVDKHYYSAPYRYVKKSVQLRITSSLIDIFCEGQLIASHLKNNLPYKQTTLVDHMPKNHIAYLEWTPERIIQWAQKTGSHTSELIQHVMASKEHPQQGFRASLGILRLGKRYGDTRLEKACQRALALGVYRYKNIESILKNGLDQVAIVEDIPPETKAPLPDHTNIRGSHYYQSSGEML